MNETLELEVVDLGDAKEVTLGVLSLIDTEGHPDIVMRD